MKQSIKRIQGSNFRELSSDVGTTETQRRPWTLGRTAHQGNCSGCELMMCRAAFLYVSAWLHSLFAGHKQGWTKWIFGFHGALVGVNVSFHLVHISASCDICWSCTCLYVHVCEINTDDLDDFWSKSWDYNASDMHLPVLLTVFQITERQTVQKWSHCAYLCLRCGLQVTQPVAKPLRSQAELAILLLDAGHALEHHFIILSRQKQTSVCVSVHASIDAVSKCDMREPRFTHTHVHILVYWSGENLVPQRP